MTRLLSLAIVALVCLVCISPTFAAVFNYAAILDGPSESPANASPGTGYATIDYDDVAHSLALNITFSGLTGNTTASHIHAPTAVAFTSTAGVATTTPYFAGFPIGVTAGVYANTLDLTLASSFNGAFDGGTPATQEPALAAAMAAGKAYLNIHSTTFPGGEIRGFLIPVPEPSTFVLAGLGAVGLWAVRRRRAR